MMKVVAKKGAAGTMRRGCRVMGTAQVRIQATAKEGDVCQCLLQIAAVRAAVAARGKKKAVYKAMVVAAWGGQYKGSVVATEQATQQARWHMEVSSRVG
jgi:hypothetical protein